MTEKTKYFNELRPEFLGVTALNPFAAYISPSRAVMFSSHITQRLVVNGANRKRITTGIEREFGDYTFNIKMPEDGRILKIIDRYPKGITYNSLEFNPETLVLYESDKTGEIGMFTIPYYFTAHQYFGFRYELTDNIQLLKIGAYIPKDTIFADTPAKGKNREYNTGVNLNVAFMSLPGVAEDGMIICSDVLERFTYKIYETRVVELGSKDFPLNLFGTTTKYKPFLDIGETINNDGLLMVLRDYNEDLFAIDTSIYDTMEPDYLFDKAVYVKSGKGKIVDIKVVGNNNKNKNLPVEIMEYLEKYRKALQTYHSNVIQAVDSIQYEKNRTFRDAYTGVSPELHRLLVESLAITNYSTTTVKQNLSLLHRKKPIDEYRIEFVIEYEVMPDIGGKLTCNSGGKGIIVKIEKPENMPYDEAGNRADLIVDGGSGIDRIIPGRHYEHYVAGSARDTSKRVKEMLGFNREVDIDYKLLKPIRLNDLYNIDELTINNTYNYLMGYYYITSQEQYNFFSTLTHEEKLMHLMDVVNNGIYVYLPINTQTNIPDMIWEGLENNYPQTYGPVTYVGNSGKKVTTKKNIRIAPLYIMLLEKTGREWLAVSSAKVHPLGILAPITKADKYRYPFRESPARVFGEAEVRIQAAYLEAEAIAELMDRNNNMHAMKNIAKNILLAEVPTNIDEVIDREQVPLGGSKSLQVVKHMFQCACSEIVYEPEELFSELN